MKNIFKTIPVKLIIFSVFAFTVLFIAISLLCYKLVYLNSENIDSSKVIAGLSENKTDIAKNEITVSNISYPVFSIDKKILYFISPSSVTSNAVFSAIVDTGEITFVCDGNSLDVIKRGKYAGYLLILKHKYFQDMNGSYDHYFVVDSSGNEIKDVGNYDKDDVLESLE